MQLSRMFIGRKFRLSFLGICLLVSQTLDASSFNSYFEIITPPTLSSSGQSKIIIPSFLDDVKLLTKQHPEKISYTVFGKVSNYELLRLDIRSATLLDAPTVLITGGIHGNETLGALASFEFVKKFLQDSSLNENFNLIVIPATNPRALSIGQRRYLDDKTQDLNRHFVPSISASTSEILFDRAMPEAKLIAASLEPDSQKIAMLLDLHGGPTRQHFFSIRANEDNGLAASAISSSIPAKKILSSNDNSYPGRTGIPSDPDRYVMPAEGVAESKLEGTFKAYVSAHLGAKYAYTLEYPMRNPLEETLTEYVNLIEGFFRELKKIEHNKESSAENKSSANN